MQVYESVLYRSPIYSFIVPAELFHECWWKDTEASFSVSHRMQSLQYLYELFRTYADNFLLSSMRECMISQQITGKDIREYYLMWWCMAPSEMQYYNTIWCLQHPLAINWFSRSFKMSLTSLKSVWSAISSLYIYLGSVTEFYNHQLQPFPYSG